MIKAIIFCLIFFAVCYITAKIVKLVCKYSPKIIKIILTAPLKFF